MPSIYHVGDLTLDVGRQELRRGAEPIHLGPLTYRVLLALIKTAPNVVSHDELADAVWGGRAVSQETISQRIKLLRSALGEDARNPRYFELLRGRGYRLIPPVVATAGSEKARKGGGNRAIAIGAAAGIAVAMIATVLLTAQKDSSTRALDERAERPARLVAPEHSIAVLPFENLSGDPGQEYFVEGMHDALISELARIDSLTVISRTSAQHYAETTQTLSEIARELNVSKIIEGSVLRSANQVRIQIRLIGLHPERYLLAQTYDREMSTVLRLQSEIARDIANRIKVRLSSRERSRLAQAGAVDSKAYTAWLKGNFHLSRLDEASFRKALEYFHEAIDRDPQYAPAWAGLAMAHTHLGGWHASLPPQEVVGPARKAAKQALALDPELPTAYLALGQIATRFDWDWQTADRAFERGTSLNPSNSAARIEYQSFLSAMGRFQEAIDFGKQTLRLDPLAPAAYTELAFAYRLSGRDGEALDLWREGLAIDPHFLLTHGMLCDFYLRSGKVDEVLVHLAPFDGRLQTLSPSRVGLVASRYARVGRQSEARRLLSEFRERRRREHIPAITFVYIHLGLGETEKALQWLEVAYDEREVSLMWLREFPIYAALRSDPRFRDIVDRMNFPARP